MGIILLFRGCEEMVIFILKQAYNLYTLLDKLFFSFLREKPQKICAAPGKGTVLRAKRARGAAWGASPGQRLVCRGVLSAR